MEYIAHRINTVEQLKETPHHFGVELDLRNYADRLIIEHDPFTDGETFENYLKHYKHGTMILNVKSERIEHKILELIKKYKIKDYFFLDSSFPMIHLLSQTGETKIAIRFSEYEGLDTIINMADKVDWVWVDCFTKLPITKEIFDILKSYNFKLCLVSPELQGQNEKIEIYKSYLNKNHIQFDAICTKIHNVDRWK